MWHLICLHVTEVTHPLKWGISLPQRLLHSSTTECSSGHISNCLCWSSSANKYILVRSSVSHQQAASAQVFRGFVSKTYFVAVEKFILPSCVLCLWKWPGREEHSIRHNGKSSPVILPVSCLRFCDKIYQPRGRWTLKVLWLVKIILYFPNHAGWEPEFWMKPSFSFKFGKKKL